MNFCSACGERVVLEVPPDDDRERYVCAVCATVHYENPKVVAGSIPEREERVLLCRRAIEPRHGLWTLPAGFMEQGETTAEAAARETLEEANSRVRILGLYSIFDIPRISQLYLMFRAELLEPTPSAGRESLEVRLFSEAEIPWDELAFPVIEETLERYFADRRAGRFGLHRGVIRRRPGEKS